MSDNREDMARTSPNAPARKESSSEASPEAAPRAPSIVFQPQKLTEVMEVINVMGSISEKISDQHDVKSDGTAAAASGSGSSATRTRRDQAIAQLPSPEIMQKKLLAHIDAEVASLTKEAREISRRRGTGWAYDLTRLYARIRRLSALAHEILRASVDVVKRFYILVFIDGQALVQTPVAPRPA